ncbi:MAG: hypothetical protein K8R54_00590 [Bacteroidales bacterium]|nr:hypothetical protein [Bacteroidales bacterium]
MKVQKFSKKLMFAAAVVILLNFSNCKYDDGPAVSLLTKTMRLTGEWEVIEIDNENVYGLYLEFEKDGDFTFTYSYDGYSYSYEGDWEWESGKEAIEITVDGEKEEFDILRLTNKELWFEDENNNEWQCEKE